VKARSFVLVTVLATMLGGTSALAQTSEDPPEAELTAEEVEETSTANTLFEATFTPSVDEETAYIEYHVCKLTADEDDEAACGDEPELTVVEIETNGEGEINHGMVVSSFVKHLKDNGYKGIGCLVRYVAQSNWGKDVAEEDLTEISAETDCPFNRGGDEEDEDSQTGGKPAWAGQGPPPWAGGPNDTETAEADDSDSDSDDGKGRPDWAGTPGGPHSKNG
jgi:hypothetical protein